MREAPHDVKKRSEDVKIRSGNVKNTRDTAPAWEIPRLNHKPLAVGLMKEVRRQDVAFAPVVARLDERVLSCNHNQREKINPYIQTRTVLRQQVYF